jgi:adenylate kinase family enzyme
MKRRILIYGVTGSGKTTLAEKVAAKTGIPLHLADEIGWNPGWQEVPMDEQILRVEKVVAEDSWILDSAYGKWLDVVLPRTELIVCLDYPRWISLGRLVRRTFRRCCFKETSCNGSQEMISRALSRDSIILWHFKAFPNKKRRMNQWATHSDGPMIVTCKSPKDAERWLSALKPAR